MFKNLRNSLIIVFAAVVVMTSMAVLPIYTVPAEAQTVNTDCPPDSVNPDCQPPKLKEFEDYLAQMLGMIWAMAGLVFLVFLFQIGFIYLTGSGQPEKEAEAKSRAGKWMLGIILLFFARTLVATVMQDLIGDSNDCYDTLDDGIVIQFFFADVCTEGDVVPTIPGTGASGSYCTQDPDCISLSCDIVHSTCR